MQRIPAIITPFLLALAGCGSESGDNPAPPVEDLAPGGYYTGTLTQDGKNQSIEGLVTEDGYAVFISADGVYAGQLGVEGSVYENVFKAYTFPGATWDGSNTVLTGSIKGTIKERNSLSGDYSLGDVTGKVALSYEKELYEQPASTARIAGDWGYTIGSYQLTLTFSEDGSYFGQDSSGCTLAGKWSIPDEDFNGYRIKDGAISCGYGATAFTGVAMIYEEPSVDSDVIVIGMHNAKYAYVDVLIRQ